MADQSVEKNIQFSLEAIDLDEDIEMTDELFCNGDVDEDFMLSEKEIFDLFFLSPFSFIFYNLIPVLNLAHLSLDFLSY